MYKQILINKIGKRGHENRAEWEKGSHWTVVASKKKKKKKKEVEEEERSRRRKK